MKVSIITVAYNMPHYTKELFETAMQDADKQEIDFYLFLHSMHEETVEMCNWLYSNYPCHYYDYGTNRGLSLSWNDGMLEAFEKGADLVLIANDDINFSAGDIDKIAKKAYNNRDKYMVSVAGFHAGDGKRNPSHGYSCFALNPIALEKIGCFDENIFPIYFEDCLSPDTPILTSDLRWIPIGDAEVGMNIVGVDEKNTSPQARRYRLATITKVTRKLSPSLRIIFTDGREVICSKNHKWLARNLPLSYGNIQRWVYAKDLNENRCVVSPLETWQSETDYNAGWLAGMLDGEGSLHVSPKKGSYGLTISQKPGEVLDSVKKILSDMDIPFTDSTIRASGVVSVEVNIRPKVFELLGRVRPVRFISKNAWDGVTIRSKGVERFAYVERIEEVGEMELIDISTTTGTFIANGLVSHNCDHHYRATLLGLVEDNCPDTEVWHGGSSAINNDEMLSLQNLVTQKTTGQYYVRKWGGLNGQEVFMVPFNNDKFTPYISPEERHKPYPGYNRTDQQIVAI